MFQAITTKYLGPTNTKGSRVKATAAAGSVILGYDDAMNSQENHTQAALQLANKYGWKGTWHGGGLNDGGYVFVCEGNISIFVSTGDKALKQ
jgi:hypothetical protein